MSPSLPARRVTIVGIGAGDPDQITVEAVRALQAASFAIVALKRDEDPLVAARQAIVDRHAPGLELVPVTDPERDRSAESTSTAQGYRSVVADWHDARAAAYERVLLDREGDAVFLVWGDPALYDSTIRIIEKVLARGRVTFAWDVIAGISALQVLAARHRIVLHEIGQPLVVTTGRRLREAVDAGAENVVVMLSARLDLEGGRVADLVGSQCRDAARTARRRTGERRAGRDRGRSGRRQDRRGLGHGHLFVAEPGQGLKSRILLRVIQGAA